MYFHTYLKKMHGITLLVALSLICHCQALKCYACIGTQDIKGLDIPSVVLSLLSGLPPCTRFNPDSPDASYIQDCPLLNDKSCVKITDPNDSRNQIRSCFPLTKEEKCESPFCYCGKDLCNGAERDWPSAAVMVLAAGLAALFGAV